MSHSTDRPMALHGDVQASTPMLALEHTAADAMVPTMTPAADGLAALAPDHATDERQSIARVLADAEQRARAGRFDDVIGTCEALMPRLHALADDLLLGSGHQVLMLCHHYAGRAKESMLAGYRAIEHFQRAGAEERLPRALALQAINVARLGDASQALDLLDRGMKGLGGMGAAPREQCLFWNNAGVVYHVLGQFALAVDAAERSMNLLDGFTDLDLPFVCACNLLTYRVELARSQDATRPTIDLPSALNALVAHMDCLQASGRRHLIARCVEAAVEGMIELGRFDEARALLRREIEAARSSGTGPKRGGLELRLARVERLGGRRNVAAKHITTALELLAQGQDQYQLARAHLEHSLLQEAGGRWRAALESHKRYAETREKLLKAQADSRAQALATQLDLERSRAEAEVLRRRNAELQGSMDRLNDEAGELKRQAHEDPLTGLSNRRQLELGIGELQRRHHGQPLAIMVIDIDHFKRINDDYTHAVGDAVLKEMGRLLRHLSRPGDVVARVGGEEFVVAFAGALRLDGALHVAQRLRAAIEQHDWHQQGAPVRVTASIGLAHCQPAETFDTALKRADCALYECKRNGRNQVRCAY